MVGRLARITVNAPLRVLAYHEIKDAGGFAAQMEHIAGRYRPVSVGEVLGWLDGRALPPAAVWVTFDDGDPTVVERGLPVLERYGVPATMFICPGVVDTDQPYWWQIVESIAPGEVAGLKLVDDARRVDRVAELAEVFAQHHGVRPTRPQLTSSQLKRWLDSGRDVGNHTWDHPLLDRCDERHQERQIVMAHEWIVDRAAPEQLVFAYPNGNGAPRADAVLDRLGYRVSALFDHRLTSMTRGGRLSRLRTNADGDLARFRSIVSGVHPTIHRMRGGR
jgi:peptidoglycan/xylan/chitin deacetylase (PgdA/CDA1 family)